MLIFFFFVIQFRLFPLLCLSDCWSIFLYLLICCLFPLVYFSFLLWYSSALIGTFFYFLSLYWSSKCVVHPWFSQFSSHVYDHNFDLFIRQIVYPCLFSSFWGFVLFFLNIVFCLLILTTSLWLFLCIRQLSNLSWSWRSGLIWDVLWVLEVQSSLTTSQLLQRYPSYGHCVPFCCLGATIAVVVLLGRAGPCPGWIVASG